MKRMRFLACVATILLIAFYVGVYLPKYPLRWMFTSFCVPKLEHERINRVFGTTGMRVSVFVNHNQWGEGEELALGILSEKSRVQVKKILTRPIFYAGTDGYIAFGHYPDYLFTAANGETVSISLSCANFRASGGEITPMPPIWCQKLADFLPTLHDKTPGNTDKVRWTPFSGQNG